MQHVLFDAKKKQNGHWKMFLKSSATTHVKHTPWKVRANAKGRHVVRKLLLLASVVGRHLPNWKTVHHLEKANQETQLWRDDTLEAAGADGGEQPFINRAEMHEDSHLQPRTVWRHITARGGPILSGKSLNQDN